MKKILIILLALCLFIPVVLGNTSSQNSDEKFTTGVGRDEQGGSPNYTDSGGKGDTSHDSKTAIKGLRISYVTADGQDIFSKDYFDGGLTGVYHTMGSPVSKPQYMSPYRTKPSDESAWNEIDIDIDDISELERYSTVSGSLGKYTFNIDYRGALHSASLKDLYKPLEELPSGMTENQLGNYRWLYFNQMIAQHTGNRLGLHLFKFDSSKEDVGYLYNVFIVTEPLTIVKINGDFYYGTAYELASIAKSKDGGGWGDICINDSNGALCDLSNPLRGYYPCMGFVTGVISEQMSILGADSYKRYFSSSSYFGERIKINNNASSVCSVNNGKFTPQEAVGNYGIGMTVVWISGIGLDDVEPEEPLPPDKKYNCTPQFGVGTCIDGKEISYIDIGIKGNLEESDYWEHCVFNDDGYYELDDEHHKFSDKTKTYTYYESGLGDSDYCEVYCTETLNINLARGNIIVEAGRWFMWGESNATGGRTCRTKSVNWTKFKNDLTNANNAVRDAYGEWQVEKLKAEAIANPKNLGEDEDNCCIGWEPVQYYNPAMCYNEFSDTAEIQSCINNSSGLECASAENRYSASWDSYVVDGKTYSGGTEYWCGNAKPATNVQGKESAYNAAVDKVPGIIKKMKSCYNWYDRPQNIYNANPIVRVKYDDTAGYDYYGILDSTITYTLTPGKEDKTDSVVGTNCDKTNQEEIITSCSGNSCTRKKVSVEKCTKVEYTRTAEMNFSLNDEVYRYVIKGPSESEFSVPSNNNFTTNYYDMGIPNFPVHYSVPDGVYGAGHKGSLSLEYEKFGHSNGNSSTPIDNILEYVNNNYGDWACQFTVYSKLIPDPGDSGNGSGNGPGDIRVVYRTIDLVDPFPDIDGSRRNTGSNWCNKDGDCSYNNNTVKEYITNNRDVKDYEIYSEEPMYTFILTPKIIKEIRRYNSVNSYADYTGSLDGKNYDYKCNNNGINTGKYCISDYLSYIIDITGAKNQPGSCVDDKYRNYNDTGNFETCRDIK